MFGGTACHASTEAQKSIEIVSRTLPQLVAGIVTRAAELNYITEQDSEVFAFDRNTPVPELRDDVFLQLLRRPEETIIIEQSSSAFFEIRTRNDPTGRWKILQKFLDEHLTHLTVFRVSRDSPFEAQYDLFVVGLLNGNTVVGVQMFGVAT